MALYERITWLLIGAAIGFVIGYIVALLRDIKEDLETVDECVRHCQLDHEHITRPVKKRFGRRKDQLGFMRKPVVADIAYLFALALILLGLYRMNGITDNIEEKAHADLVARCESSVESRTVQRETVEAIYNLAIQSVIRGTNAPALTKEELRQYNAYILRVDKFREDLYKKIVPSEQCKPYVEDDVVVPPTPPTPPLVQSGRTTK